jgi:hypothetical protein
MNTLDDSSLSTHRADGSFLSKFAHGTNPTPAAQSVPVFFQFPFLGVAIGIDTNHIVVSARGWSTTANYFCFLSTRRYNATDKTERYPRQTWFLAYKRNTWEVSWRRFWVWTTKKGGLMD